MSSASNRQSELFLSQDWQILYQTFTQINFNASDPTSIAEAMHQYISVNYSEVYNDFISSSEVIAYIDLLAYLGGVLAYKKDISVRENFLDTAQGRDSILRLARFISYNPSRNRPSNGLLKVVAISTDDDVYDSANNNLKNTQIFWDDPSNTSWNEQFVNILNDAFEATNPFGVPLKSETISNVTAQMYRFNGRFGNASLSFSSTINGTSMPFDVYNVDLDSILGIVERAPDENVAMNMVYCSDNNGNSSPNTGFFMGFKQGTLSNSLNFIPAPYENNIIDVNINNINQTDVWVQTLNDDGSVAVQWTQVPTILGENISFNSLPTSVRNIFSVVTRDNDQVSIRFSDGRFGIAPVGTIRIWNRVSNGLTYQIRPSDISDVSVTVSYQNQYGAPHTLTLWLSLQSPVANSTSAETIDDVRRRAPMVYQSQNRMVSGADYNQFPLQNNLALKVNAVSRIYSGHSRFFDMNDPTGSFKSTKVFSDDGIFYKDVYNYFTEVATAKTVTAKQLIDLHILPAITGTEMRNYMLDHFVKLSRTATVPNITWNQVSDARYSSTGWFSVPNALIVPGAFLLMVNGSKQQWVSIAAASGAINVPPSTGNPGTVTLSSPIPNTWVVKGIVPTFTTAFSQATIDEITTKLQSTQSFSIWYDYSVGTTNEHWFIGYPDSLSASDSFLGTATKVMNVEYLAGNVWRFSAVGLRYVFESLSDVQFFYDGNKGYDDNGVVKDDVIKILKVNPNPNTGLSPKRDYGLKLDKPILYADGYADPSRVAVQYEDADGDGCPDDPDTYYQVIDNRERYTYLFWKMQDTGTNAGLWVPYYNMIVYDVDVTRIEDSSQTIGTVCFQIDGVIPLSFWKFGSAGWTQIFDTYRVGYGRGPNIAAKFIDIHTAVETLDSASSLYFLWKHYSPSDHRIDPAKTNIIDTFVLTSDYDYQIRLWVANGSKETDIPAAPTEFDLRSSFAEMEKYKMFSDEIVWKPAKYKMLFGNGAAEELKATIKCIKLPSASLSDGEIQAKVVNTIDAYFSADNWNFGDTFYFSELGAALHRALSTQLASVVIVPNTANGTYGDLTQIGCGPDEIFISTATVSNVTIIDSNTPSNLRMK